MKRLEISRLMDDYVDNEFCPEEGSAVSAETVKAQVLAKAAPAGKRTPKKKRPLLAAALAAVMVVLVGAGYPIISHQLAAGGALSFQQVPDGKITSFVHYAPVVELVDGRLIFSPEDDQDIDITDLVSEEKPYLYDASRPEEGVTYYIIIGGTTERFGYLEWITTPNPFRDGDDPVNVEESRMTTAYEFVIRGAQDDWRSIGSIGIACVEVEKEMDQPWLLAGMTELGIPFEYAPKT